MRQYLTVLVILAVLVTAGCVEEPAPEVPVTAATPATTAPTAAPDTPTPTPTPAPEAVAYISGIECAVGDRSEAAYHCNGIVRIPKGSYENVQVIVMYRDNNTFRSGSVSLGGTDSISKPFALFPDIKYKGQTPTYFVKLDGMICPVVNGGGGTLVAMSNSPVPDAVKNH